MACEYCGSTEVDYVGMDDGGGAYGTQVCDTYHCLNCDQYFEGGCIDEGDFEGEELGDDGYPLDMDDTTKAWLSTNR